MRNICTCFTYMYMLTRDAAEFCNSFNGITAGQNQGHPVWVKS